METLKFYKETALPTTLVPHAVYYIAPTEKPNYVEVYVTDAVGKARRQITDTDVAGMIAAQMQGVGHMTVVDTIAARDNIKNPLVGSEVFVLDASADTTVSKGGARYLRQNNSWTKIAEMESMDLVLSWQTLTGKPTSAPSDIDAAVATSHTHINKTQLDKIGQDSDGNMTYGGAPVATAWKSTGW